MPRLLAWNIRHGGGARRMAPISLTLLEHGPDLVVLSEFRRTTGGQIAAVLADHGLVHQVSTDPGPGRNGMLLVSRVPLHTVPEHPGGASKPAPGNLPALSRRLPDRAAPPTAPVRGRAGPNRHRWLEAEVPDLGLSVLAVHAPHDDPIRPGRASTARAAFFQALVGAARESADRPTVLLGDFNAGRHYVDEVGATFTLTSALGLIASAGYTDAWRHLNPAGREYTWYSHAGGGFRIDHAFLSRPLLPHLRSCRYSHAERQSGLSDHSVLLLDLD